MILVSPAWWPFARTLALFTGGFVILGYDVFTRDQIRTSALIAALTMMGLDRMIAWKNGTP